jgi:hypothetical protein
LADHKAFHGVRWGTLENDFNNRGNARSRR